MKNPIQQIVVLCIFPVKENGMRECADLHEELGSCRVYGRKPKHMVKRNVRDATRSRRKQVKFLN